jgi:HEAT repeat protein
MTTALDYAAFLAGIAGNIKPADLEIGRRYLHDSDREIQQPAISILGAIGTGSDIPSLIKVIEKSHDQGIKLAAAFAIADIARNIGEDVNILLNTKNPAAIAAILRRQLELGNHQLNHLLDLLLQSDNDDTRISGLAYLIGQWSADELESLLRRYTSQSSYYYNVVCWLDRVLYAPTPFKELFRSQILAKIPLDPRR